MSLYNKLKSLKVAKSKDDDGEVVDGSVVAGDVNVVLMLCVMFCVMLSVMLCMLMCVMLCVVVWLMMVMMLKVLVRLND